MVFENGIGSALRVATKEEWNRIMAENRTLPREQRRFFIRDCIEDCEVIDSLYIEVDKNAFYPLMKQLLLAVLDDTHFSNWLIMMNSTWLCGVAVSVYISANV